MSDERGDGGYSFRLRPFEEGKHASDFLIFRYKPEAGCVLVTMHMTSGQVLTRLLKLDPAWTLEEMWRKHLGRNG